jgi:hypothetical protein
MPIPFFLKCPDFPMCRSDTMMVFSSSQKINLDDETRKD